MRTWRYFPFVTRGNEVPEWSGIHVTPAPVPSHALELTGSSRVPRVPHVFSRHRSSRTGVPDRTSRRAPQYVRQPGGRHWYYVRALASSPFPSPSPVSVSRSPLPLPSSASHSRGSRTFWVPLKATCPLKIHGPNLPPPTPGSSTLGAISVTVSAVPSYDLNAFHPLHSFQFLSLPALVVVDSLRSPLSAPSLLDRPHYRYLLAGLNLLRPRRSSPTLSPSHRTVSTSSTLVALFDHCPYPAPSSSTVSDFVIGTVAFGPPPSPSPHLVSTLFVRRSPHPFRPLPSLLTILVNNL
jgi:hypothetical protein